MNDATRQSSQTAAEEVADLERRLAEARSRLVPSEQVPRQDALTSGIAGPRGSVTGAAHHYLLLLSDSALPLGSFAFSSGLESYLAHTKPASSFSTFLVLSLSAYASTTLPYVLAAHQDSTRLVELDDLLDATIMCTVGRRASVAQGRALLSIWDRSFSSSLPFGTSDALVQMLREFSASLRLSSSNSSDLPLVSAHLGPLFGVVASVLGLSLLQSAYVFMLSHVKALLSAAVRASMFGPYQAQKLLAGVEVQTAISKAIDQEWATKVEDAGQTVPVMDLWVGRHEMLYSRIFNS